MSAQKPPQVDMVDRLLASNKAWVKTSLAADPSFFKRLADGQRPDYLFIGCSDSRVPANTLTGTGPGEMFVHRNIANQFFPHDLNCLSVLQFAVEVLDVACVLVCGHYGCGGVKAAAGNHNYGVVDNWLGELRSLAERYRHLLEPLPEAERHRRLVELSVLQQVYNLSLTPVLRHAWAKGRRPTLAGLVYDVSEGVLHRLVSDVASPQAAADLLPDRRAQALPPLLLD
jgi:carbonic anhydrase